MTPTERISVIETLELMEKHKDFAKKIGLVNKTNVANNERRSDMLTKEKKSYRKSRGQKKGFKNRTNYNL